MTERRDQGTVGQGSGARSELDRESPLPLWAQLLERLRARIASGDFVDRFPTDQELVDEYQVSRHTVREAVRRIQADGILDRRRGRGTYIAPTFEQPLGSIYSLFRSIEAAGVEQTSVVLRQEAIDDADVAARLDIPDDTRFFHLVRLRLAGDEVLAIDRIWIPMDVAKQLLDADFTKTAVYDELRDRVGVVPETGRESIQPVIPTREERKQLGIDDEQAAFLIERQTFADGTPLEWRETLVRGDTYRFVRNWTAQDPTGAGSSDFRSTDR